MPETDRVTGMPLLVDSDPAPKRRSPRKLGGGAVIKLRITADSEDDALRACALVEELLAELNCRMQRPRQGGNPRYADDPKFLAYGDFELPLVTRRRTVKRKRV
jgi:hypothetical protein